MHRANLLLGIVAFCFADATATTKLNEQSLQQTVPTKFLGLDVKGNPIYMPLIGAGTWQYDEDEAYESVCKAFEAGYTFVDTAYGYKNQKGVGKAIKDCWKGNRTDLFVMTKIPGELTLIIIGLGEDLVESNSSRLNLGCSYFVRKHLPYNDCSNNLTFRWAQCH